MQWSPKESLAAIQKSIMYNKLFGEKTQNS